jgi:hypothetical protein
MNEKITFTLAELQAESDRCLKAQQERINAILAKKSEEIRKEKFGADKEHIALNIYMNWERINDVLSQNQIEETVKLMRTNNTLVRALDLIDADEKNTSLSQ